MLIGWAPDEARAILRIVNETAFAPVWALPLVMESLGYQNMGLPQQFLPGGGITLPQEDLANAFWSEYQIDRKEDAGLDREIDHEQLREFSWPSRTGFSVF